MVRHLFTVDDTYMAKGRGVVLLPGIIPQVEEHVEVGDPIRLIRPDGSEFESCIWELEHFVPQRRRSDEIVIVLKGLNRDDVPIGTEVWSMDKFPCSCCGYMTLKEKPPGTYEICPVCFWEDDVVQLSDPDFAGGANVVSLRQAQRNFLEIGVSDPRFKKNVRAPRPGEERSPEWRPLDPLA